jgi:CRP-like cAMP-binding protein
VIDLELSDQEVPDSVIGVPTYLLNECIVSLGNPRREEFLLQLQNKVIEQLSQRLALCQARLEEMAYRSVPARIAAVLLRLSRENGEEVEQAIPITHQELREMVGALRESVTKVLDEFQRAGLVELRRGSIRVHESEELERLLQE